MLMIFCRKLTIRLAVLTAFFVLLSPGAAFAAQHVKVTGSLVNVRTGPGENYQVKMQLMADYPLLVLSSQGDWLKVRDFENDQGWIHRSFVTQGDTVIVIAKTYANMRSEPSTNGQIVANVDREVVLTKLETRGKWVKLKHLNGTIGWIYAPLLWP